MIAFPNPRGGYVVVRVSPRILGNRIEAAKAGVSLLTVAQDLTTLRKRGRRWRGKCPLCENGTHSDAFSLDDDKGLWYCFACGLGGDVVRLVELWGPFSVAEAVAWLGHKYGLDLPERPGSWFKKQDRQARLRERLQRERGAVLRRRLFKIALLPLLDDCDESEIRQAWEDFSQISVWAFVDYKDAASG